MTVLLCSSVKVTNRQRVSVEQVMDPVCFIHLRTDFSSFGFRAVVGDIGEHFVPATGEIWEFSAL